MSFISKYLYRFLLQPWVTADFVCRKDKRIEKESASIRGDEQAKLAQVRKDQAKEFQLMMKAVADVAKSLSQYEKPPSVADRSWCYGQPSEPGDYEWVSPIHSLDPNEVTVYRNYNGDPRSWGRDVWFRKISGADHGE